MGGWQPQRCLQRGLQKGSDKSARDVQLRGSQQGEPAFPWSLEGRRPAPWAVIAPHSAGSWMLWVGVQELHLHLTVQ